MTEVLDPPVTHPVHAAFGDLVTAFDVVAQGWPGCKLIRNFYESNWQHPCDFRWLQHFRISIIPGIEQSMKAVA